MQKDKKKMVKVKKYIKYKLNVKFKFKICAMKFINECVQ